MTVYVQNKDGQPLMPTTRCGKVRRMLKNKQAKVIKRCPFVIRLLYETTDVVQPVTLGVDAGSKMVGLSATTETKELYASEVQLRNDIVELLSTRKESRRARRNRKTRYRKPRFDNRVKSKRRGWLAPSVEQKINSHLYAIREVHKILPITKIVVELASFDTQKLKADIEGLKCPEGAEYQQGEQLGFWNVREYVLCRDGHECACCHGKSKDTVLNVHHIESRKIGGDAPNNLITLCETCHRGYHKGTVKLPSAIKRGVVFRDAAFMGVMRWNLYNRLKDIYSCVLPTYGYITKHDRISHGLPKTHCVDARCISGHPDAEPSDCYYYQQKVRCHNRQIHKFVFKRCIRQRNQAPYLVKDFRLFDKVLYNNEEAFIFGRRSSGYFDVRKLGGTKLSASASYKKLKLLECKKYYLIERRQHSSQG